MRLEATVHRIGGADVPGVSRKYGPDVFELVKSATEYRDVIGADNAAHILRISFDLWAPAGENWLSCRIRLEDVNGYTLGLRPALVYSQPYDIPTYTTFQPRWPDAGVFSLGLRMIAV